MTLTAELYFSFRSPYSYLSIGRYRAMSEAYDLEIALRPVYPIAIRDPDILFTNALQGRYIFIDAARSAQMLEIPYRWPRPDPVVQDMMTRKVSEDQPYIYRLTRMGQAAQRQGKGVSFADEVSRIIWSGETDDWHKGGHLSQAVARAGLDFDELDAVVEAEAEALDAEITANQDALTAAGHWGVPTLVFEGEPFFGQDRIEMVNWRMKQKGLTKR